LVRQQQLARREEAQEAPFQPRNAASGQLANAYARWPEPAVQLTPREREILAWVARGKTNHTIAATLYVSPGTIKKHLDNIYAKLDLPNRTAAVREAYGFSEDLYVVKRDAINSRRYRGRPIL
jgi:DNA-binding CsgD family transcriptional regulator